MTQSKLQQSWFFFLSILQFSEEYSFFHVRIYSQFNSPLLHLTLFFSLRACIGCMCLVFSRYFIVREKKLCLCMYVLSVFRFVIRHSMRKLFWYVLAVPSLLHLFQRVGSSTCTKNSTRVRPIYFLRISWLGGLNFYKKCRCNKRLNIQPSSNVIVQYARAVQPFSKWGLTW